MNERPVDKREIRVVTFNIAKMYDLCDSLLEELKDYFDILFLQEPPWRFIRAAPSTVNKEGDEVIGLPKHPAWDCMVGPVKLGK